MKRRRAAAGPTDGVADSLDEAKAAFRAAWGAGAGSSALGGSGPEMLVSSTSVDKTLSGTFVIDVANPMSECGGPLAQEHLYKYRSGWRQPTSGNPRTPHAQRSHTVDEGGRCTL